MRVTSTMMMRNYTSRLNKVYSNMSIANQKVVANRKFLSAAESPSEALRAYKLRQDYSKNNDYLENVKDLKDTLSTVESSLMQINKMATSAYDSIIKAGGTMDAANRETLAKEIDSMQQTMLMSANAQFEGTFLFGGSSANKLPFKLENGTLTYRGVDVNAAPGTPEYAKLQSLADETIYADLGFGLDITLGANEERIITPGSAYNTAKPGIKFLGFGQNDDGSSNNLILTLGKISEALTKTPYNPDDIDSLAENLKSQTETLMSNVTQLGADSAFLETTQTRLEDNAFNLNKKMVNVEVGDPASLIMDFKELDYAYRAALQMGMNILSPSFIDFMN